MEGTSVLTVALLFERPDTKDIPLRNRAEKYKALKENAENHKQNLMVFFQRA